MALPFKGQWTDAHEPPACQLDRLAAGEDGLDDVRRQEGELKSATDVAGVGPVARGDLANRPDLSFHKLAEPEVCPCNEVKHVWVWGCYAAFARAYDQFCLDTAAPGLDRDSDVYQSIRVR